MQDLCIQLEMLPLKVSKVKTRETAATEHYLATLQRQTVVQSEFQPKIYPELSCVCDNKYEIAPFYSEL